LSENATILLGVSAIIAMWMIDVMRSAWYLAFLGSFYGVLIFLMPFMDDRKENIEEWERGQKP